MGRCDGTHILEFWASIDYVIIYPSIYLPIHLPMSIYI